MLNVLSRMCHPTIIGSDILYNEIQKIQNSTNERKIQLKITYFV